MKITAEVNGVVVAESDTIEMVEGNYYFPPNSVKKEFLKLSATEYTCPWKGECTYYNIDVNGYIVEDGAWAYPHPREAAANIAEHVAFAPQVQVNGV